MGKIYETNRVLKKKFIKNKLKSKTVLNIIIKLINVIQYLVGLSFIAILIVIIEEFNSLPNNVLCILLCVLGLIVNLVLPTYSKKLFIASGLGRFVLYNSEMISVNEDSINVTWNYKRDIVVICIPRDSIKEVTYDEENYKLIINGSYFNNIDFHNRQEGCLELNMYYENKEELLSLIK